MLKVIFTSILLLLIVSFANAGDKVSFTQDDRDRLIRLETKVEEMEKRFSSEIGGLRMELRGDVVSLRAELKEDMSNLSAELKDDMANLRTELKEDMASLGRELKDDMANLRTELKEDMASLSTELKEDMVNLRMELKEDMTSQSTGLKDDMANLRAELKDDLADIKAFMLWGFGMLFGGMLGLVGFVLWDRRTALAPAVRKSIELEEREDKIERAFKELARINPDAAKALEYAGIS